MNAEWSESDTTVAATVPGVGDQEHPPSSGSESHLTLSWILSHPLVGAAAVSSAGAGLVHAAASGTHSTERVAALLFALTAALQVGWAFFYVARPTRAAAVFGLVLNGMFAVMWLTSRTVGLPIPEALAGVEHATVQDGVAAGLGLIAAACAAIAAWRPAMVQRHRAGSIVSATAISLVVVVFSIVGVSATHGHGADSMPGMTMVPASSEATAAGSMPGMDMGSMPGMDMGSPNASTQSPTPGLVVGGLTAAEVRFAQLTVARRGQFVRMADVALSNTTDPDVTAVAWLIKADTAPDVYRMADALRAANQPMPDPAMLSAFSASGATMTGIASEPDLVKLQNSYGETFDSVFLDMLAREHDRSIASAGQLLGSGGGPITRPAARSLIIQSASQRNAIEALSDVLDGAE